MALAPTRAAIRNKKKKHARHYRLRIQQNLLHQKSRVEGGFRAIKRFSHNFHNKKIFCQNINENISLWAHTTTKMNDKRHAMSAQGENVMKEKQKENKLSDPDEPSHATSGIFSHN